MQLLSIIFAWQSYIYQIMINNKPLTYLMGNTMTLIKSKIISRFKEEEIPLTLDHYVILQLIEKKEDITQQDLANHFHRDKSIILRQMNCLINSRFVARIQDENDKRKKNLILTKVGFDTLEKARRAANDISNELLEGVTEEEFKSFEAVIKKIRQNTGETSII